MSLFANLVPLPGSEKKVPEGVKVDSLPSTEVVDVTVRLRRKQSIGAQLADVVKTNQVLSREEFADQFGADAESADLVEEFAHIYGLSVVETSLPRRSVMLRGTVEQMKEAFGVYLSHYRLANGTVYRGRTGFIYIPEDLRDKVEGVFGLDNRPQASVHFQYLKKGNGHFAPFATTTAFYPTDLARLYNYPTDVTGKGQCIAIIELGGGYRTKDIQAYFQEIGLKAPVVKSVSVDGGHNSPSTADGADGEVMLDIEVAGAIAPGATIVVYFAPNTDQGFLDAITTAIHDTKNKPSVISISWGAPESGWTEQAMTSFNEAFQSAAMLGVTVCAAAGDTGSADGEKDGRAHVDFPSSSPYVLACGGTKLTASNGAIQNEVVWHESNDSATGGGISDVFPLPDYQQTAHVPKSINDNQHVGRGVPDVAAVADPATGYRVRVDGQNFVIGGTSAVAPLMAGLIALINQKAARNVGFIHPQIYAHPNAFRDIVQGDNSTASGGKGYRAGANWDACTGLGVADGQKLTSVLIGGSTGTAPVA